MARTVRVHLEADLNRLVLKRKHVKADNDLNSERDEHVLLICTTIYKPRALSRWTSTVSYDSYLFLSYQTIYYIKRDILNNSSNSTYYSACYHANFNEELVIFIDCFIQRKHIYAED